MNTDAHHLRTTHYVILAFIFVTVTGSITWWHSSKNISFSSESYQAVFLTNNQVYFGKLSKANTAYPILSDVYYIQAFAPQDLTRAASTSNSQLQLVKLGSELHQPQDTMYLNKGQILFIEPLKDDSKIIQAIENFKQNQK